MNRDFSQKAPLQNQAELLASKGRYGDSMLVHMNPREVDVLAQMVPGKQLTINPDTGQPEAFLPLLLGLAGSLAGGAGLLGGGALLGTAIGGGALGTALGSTIETGSLKEGLKAGLISGLVGGAAGQLFKGAGAVAGSGTEVGKEAGKAVLIQPPIPTSVLAEGGSQASQQIGQTLASNVAPQVTQSVAPQIASGAGADSLKQITSELAQQGAATPSMLSRIASGATPEALTQGATAGLTGQAMTDQFNLMNMDSGPMLDEDDEEFYVPVEVRDRGMQFAGSDFTGSGEFDYFSNPFGFDPVPPVTLAGGGHVGQEIRKFDMGGGIEDLELAQFNVNDTSGYDPFNSAAFFNTSTPDYFRNSFGSQDVNTDVNTDDMVETTRTEQVYTPRSEMNPNISVGNIRGAGSVGMTDYNQRLLGDPTRQITEYRPMTADEITSRDEAAAAALVASSDPYQNMLDRGDGMGMMGMPAFDPSMPAMDFGMESPYMSYGQVNTGFQPAQPVSSYGRINNQRFDPFMDMEFMNIGIA